MDDGYWTDDDMRLVVMAAAAFNMGMTQRADVAPLDKERLGDACRRLDALVGLTMVDGAFR